MLIGTFINKKSKAKLELVLLKNDIWSCDEEKESVKWLIKHQLKNGYSLSLDNEVIENLIEEMRKENY